MDSGLSEGDEIPVYYDPIIAKLIVWGKDREEAIERTKRALSEYRIHGVATSINFHFQVMGNEKFKQGDLSTHFIQEEFDSQKKGSFDENEEILKIVAISSALADFRDRKRVKISAQRGSAEESNWKIQGRKMGLRKPLF